MSKRNMFASFLTLAVGMLLVAAPSQAEEQSVYGALYQAANLEAENGGSNRESVLLYYPRAETEEEQGFIALTTNDQGIEWWTSDALGLVWTVLEDNPLEEYNCQQPGRHSPIMYNGDYYFGAACQAGATVFKLTGIDSVEMLHVTESDEESPEPKVDDGPPPDDGPDGPPPDDGPGEGDACSSAGYPTSAVVNDKLVMFYNCGFAVSDGENWVDVTDGVPEGVTLEASDEVDGLAYLAFTDGSVMSFDGETFTEIARVEGAENLPAIGVNAAGLYVGDMSNDGATLYKFNPDTEEFDVAKQLDASDTIINKMSVDENDNIVFFTANAETGTNIYSVDADGNIDSMVASGLGGENPENNSEVVSIAKREVVDNGKTKYVMAFGTQNATDQTKIFVLNVGEDLAVNATNKLLVLPEENLDEVTEDEVVAGVRPMPTKKKKRLSLVSGQVLKVKIPKKQVRSGDVFTLEINGKVVATKTAKKRNAIQLKYKNTKKHAGKTVTVEVGVKRSYGDQVSENTVTGKSIKVKVTRK